MKRVLIAALVLLLPALAFAGGQSEQPAASSNQPQTLVIWANAVHKTVIDGSGGGAGIDIEKVFEKKYNVKIEWNTIPWAQMQDKVLRELAASSSQADLIFLVNDWVSPSVLSMYEPLNSFMQKNPIANEQSIPSDMLKLFKLNGKQMLIPYRTNLNLLHYNKQLFDQAGLSAPTSMEELGADARKLTHKRSDGAQVYGFAYNPDQTDVQMLRSFGGDVFDKNMHVTVNSPAAVKAVEFLKGLYKDGAIPPNFTELNSGSIRQLYTNGLVGMIFLGDNYYVRFNNPKKSQIAGHSEVSYIPMAGGGVAPTKLAFWGVGIPKNGDPKKRQLAYDFIRYFTSEQAQVTMALNGNGPIRTSVYQDSTFASKVPYAGLAEKVLPKGEALLPAVNGSTQILDVLKQSFNEAIQGQKPVKQALDDAQSKIEQIIKQ